jgi:ketosteroid isomerase-like protein
MSEQDNVQVIQALLAAFGRGDIAAALSMVAEEVDWQSPATGTPNALLPWSAIRRSRAEVGQFFADMTAYAEPQAFEICAVTAQGDRVVLEGRNAGRARSTGRSYAHDWVMVFTVRDGLIVRHRHYYDTADVLAAFV